MRKVSKENSDSQNTIIVNGEKVPTIKYFARLHFDTTERIDQLEVTVKLLGIAVVVLAIAVIKLAF